MQHNHTQMTPSIVSLVEIQYFWFRFSKVASAVEGLKAGRIEVGFGQEVGTSTFLSMDDFPNYIVPRYVAVASNYAKISVWDVVLRGTKSCTNCEAGRAAASEGSSSSDCLLCAKGKYASVQAASCTTCAEGYYNTVLGQSRCDQCPAGKTSGGPADQGRTSCSDCPLGKFSMSQVGRQTCVPCAPGSYGSNDTRTTCEPCSKGFVNPNSGSTDRSACEKCPAGKVTFSVSLNTCSKCPVFTKPKANMYDCELEDEAYTILIAGGSALALLLSCCLGARAYQLSLRKDREERRAQLDARGAVVELQNVADPTGQHDRAVFKLTYAPPGSQRSFRGDAADTTVVLTAESMVVPAAVDVGLEVEVGMGVGNVVVVGGVGGGGSGSGAGRTVALEADGALGPGQQVERRNPELARAQHELDIALGRIDGVMLEVDADLGGDDVGASAARSRPHHRGSTWI